MYLTKSHLSTAYVLRDRPPPITFFTESLGTHALIYLSCDVTHCVTKVHYLQDCVEHVKRIPQSSIFMHGKEKLVSAAHHKQPQ